jgi:hypothetical protein
MAQTNLPRIVLIILPVQIPLSYLFVESFRLTMLAMAHPDFPFNVLGSVLTRNCSTLYRPLAATEALTYRYSCAAASACVQKGPANNFTACFSQTGQLVVFQKCWSIGAAAGVASPPM